MRFYRIGIVLPLLFAACASGKTELESGAVMLQVRSTSADAPDELFAWVYDDTGRLWDGARVPAEGKLVVKSPRDLGSILIQPGSSRGNLRIHVQGRAGGARILDGILVVPVATGSRTFDLVLDAAVPADGDGDGVPDVIDDCPETPNPAQGGCSAAQRDAGADSVAVATEVSSDVAGPVSDLPISTSGDAADRDPGDSSIKDGPFALADAGLPEKPSKDAVPEADARPSDAGRDLASGDLAPDQVAGSDAFDTAADVLAVTGPEVKADVPMDPGDAPGTGDVADALASPDLAQPDATVTTPDADESCGYPPCNLGQGSPCTSAAQCSSGACVDGVCCTNSCFGLCRSCNQPNAVGVCQAYAIGTNPEAECTGGATCNGAGACGAPPSPNQPNGQLCSSGSQCMSGFCVDGVCCNSKCDEPCFACGNGICLTVRRSVDIPECSNGKSCDKSGVCR